MKHASGEGWIGVDFDRTLATYKDWKTNGQSLGTPIPLMLERVKRWLAAGTEVRVFTARAASTSDNREEAIANIKAWCVKYLGRELEVTAEKDFNMVALYDDRAISVEPNEGYTLCTRDRHETDPLTNIEELRLWKRREDSDE